MAVIDTVFAPRKLTAEQVRELRFIPGTDNKSQFLAGGRHGQCGQRHGSGGRVPRTLPRCSLDTTIYRQEIINLIDDDTNNFNRYPGVKFGSMEAANNEAGNWED